MIDVAVAVTVVAVAVVAVAVVVVVDVMVVLVADVVVAVAVVELPVTVADVVVVVVSGGHNDRSIISSTNSLSPSNAAKSSNVETCVLGSPLAIISSAESE